MTTAKAWLRKYRPLWIFLGIIFAFAVILAGSLFSRFGLDGLLLYYGWILFMFCHYRFLRQNELIYLLAGAAETRQPLTTALWAYLADRPHSTLRKVLDAALLSFVFPGYWFWHRLHSYDQKVRRLVYLLEGGMPLPDALKAVRGVASKETVLAASVGHATGKLAETLRRVPRFSIATLWLDLMPRFFYPLFLLMTSFLIVAFLLIFIIPKFEKIFSDFKIKLPYETEWFIAVSRFVVAKYPSLSVLLGLAMMALLALLLSYPGVRWYSPVIGRFYRMHVQSRVLKMLGLLLETGQPVPQALGVLLATGYFSGMVRERLERVAAGVSLGEDLADELNRQGFLPGSMVPMVRSAQRANHLPFALSELGEHRAKTLATLANRWCLAFFPVSVMLVAVAIGFVAVSMFLPLLAMMEGVGRW